MSCFCRTTLPSLPSGALSPASSAGASWQMDLAPGSSASATLQASLAASLAPVSMAFAPALPSRPLIIPAALPFALRPPCLEPFDPALSAELRFPLLAAIGDWLAARWLPLPPGTAWRPDPAWLDLEFPTLPMRAEGMGVLLGLVMARQSIQTTFQLDVMRPDDLFRFTRIVATLNARTEQLALLLNGETRPWQALAQLNAQIDTVRAAVAAGLFTLPAQPQPSIAPWRGMLVKLKALAPLVAIAGTLQLDLADPGALTRLAVVVRQLRQIALPRLADVVLVLNLVARNDAMLRLHASLGRQFYPELRAAVALKADALLAMLPPDFRLESGVLLGLPTLPPNPGLLINAATVAQARLLTPAVTARLDWQVPGFADLPLLTVGAPVASLVAGLTGLGLNPIRLSPCDTGCDAARVMRAALPTTTPGSGTGAAPAG